MNPTEQNVQAREVDIDGEVFSVQPTGYVYSSDKFFVSPELAAAIRRIAELEEGAGAGARNA